MAAVRAAVARAERDLGHLQAFGLRPIGDLEARIVQEADWANAWKAHFPVLRVGRRIVIRPTWRRHHREPGDVVLALDPGMAFGTGLHPTTRLCLAALESMADRGLLATETAAARVLDVGSGSGILSIAAVRLGAGRVLALDVDPIAVDATRANAKRNGLARRIRAREGSSPSGEGPFDVVARQPHRVGADRARRRPGRGPSAGRHAAGLGHLREPRGRGRRGVRRPRAWRSSGRWSEGDWVALELRRPGLRRSDRRDSLRYDLASMPDLSSLFPAILATHITLAICLLVPSVLLPFTLRNRSVAPNAAAGAPGPRRAGACRGPRPTGRWSSASASRSPASR